MKTKILTSIIFFAAFFTYTDGQGFGTDGTIFFNCPIPETRIGILSKLIKSLGYNYAMLPCDQDCVYNHRAIDGHCDEQSNCICTYEGEEKDTGVPLVYSSKYCQGSVCQCALKNYTAFYDTVCYGDCLCNHGATNAVCDYDKKECRCIYDPNIPYDPSTCPVHQLIADPTHFNEMYGNNNAILTQLAYLPNFFQMVSQFLVNLQGQDTPGFIETIDSPLISPN